MACASEGSVIQFKMTDTSTGVLCNIVGLLCHGQHGLVGSLVELEISGKDKAATQPAIMEILDSLLINLSFSSLHNVLHFLIAV